MRRAGCCSLSMLLIVLSSCGGSDTPAAPTPTTPTVETPIVVSVTAQIVDNQAIMGTTTITQERTVRVTGSVGVTGGAATVEVKVTFTPTGPAGPIPIELIALALQSVSPVDVTPFDVTIPFFIELTENGGGTVRVDATGTDERGGPVAVFQELPVTPDDTLLPPTNCVEDATTLCALADRFKVTVDWADPLGNRGQGTVKAGERFEDGGWFSFAALAGLVDPGGFDLFLQMTDGCSGNTGAFGANMIANTDVEYTLTVTDTQTNQTREYFNPLGSLEPATIDPSAFDTCP